MRKEQQTNQQKKSGSKTIEAIHPYQPTVIRWTIKTTETGSGWVGVIPSETWSKEAFKQEYEAPVTTTGTTVTTTDGTVHYPKNTLSALLKKIEVVALRPLTPLRSLKVILAFVEEEPVEEEMSLEEWVES